MKCFKRRWVFSGLMAVALVPSGVPAVAQAVPLVPRVDDENWDRVAAGEMVFRWRHDRAVLRGNLAAPTAGWLAVGFNDAERLKGTCFVMAQLSETPACVELRRAVVPDHVPVADRRIRASLAMEAGAFQDGRSTLQFALPHESGATLGVKLTPGASTYLMLAWSRSTDFDHHSAFREHHRVVL
ncbi:hypothetical protein HBA54_25345 [Pelagibius litoralis]|uniref:DOMON domain-containing protein n=1 Tax=Pelagibius litoralis TaxID=374515 RepID=A0A967F2Q6_9PROT|nr:hypothetical protein [Pelagibius litoralis]NIA71929.1 hypothetical protein [Pelagibius litoralis]